MLRFRVSQWAVGFGVAFRNAEPRFSLVSWTRVCHVDCGGVSAVRCCVRMRLTISVLSIDVGATGKFGLHAIGYVDVRRFIAGHADRLAYVGVVADFASWDLVERVCYC